MTLQLVYCTAKVAGMRFIEYACLSHLVYMFNSTIISL